MSKSRSVFAMAAVTAVLALTARCCAAVTLVYSDHEPLGNMRTRFLNEVFFPAVEKESDSRVVIERYWNGELSTSYNALKTVKEGKTAQMTVAVPEYTPREFPLQLAFKSFPTGPSGQTQADFFRDVYARSLPLHEEFERQNVHPVLIATGFPAAFFSTAPLKKIRDLKGQTWRTASFWHRDFLRGAGANPVTIPWGPRVFEALADGSLDGLIVNEDSGYDINAHKAARYVAVSPKLWLGHAYPIVVNKDVWDSLSDENKQAFERAAQAAAGKLGELMDAALPELLQKLRNDGAEVRFLSDAEVEEWKRLTQYRTAQDSWIEEQRRSGHETAANFMEMLRDRLEAR